jgi:hypothetical protein
MELGKYVNPGRCKRYKGHDGPHRYTDPQEERVARGL